MVAVPLGASLGMSVHLEPSAVKRKLIAGFPASPNGLKGKRVCRKREEPPLRLQLIALTLLALAAGQGCATQDRASSAAALADSEDDTACQKLGAPDSEAHEVCRQQRADARAQAAAVQEQRRRDFDRTLGAGTDAQTSF